MEQEYKIDPEEGYQSTVTYQTASHERRRQFNRYKKECNISDEHMYMMLYQMDLLMVPDEVRKKGDVAMSAMLVLGFLLLWSSLQSAMNSQGGANVLLIFLSVASFVLVAIVYYLGLLNPYKRAVREINRRLKKMPDVPDFYEWDNKNPAKPEESKPSGKKKRRKRR